MNSFFGLGPMELFVILVITLIVLGPQRLPGTIREVMKYWRYFRNLSGELTAQLGEEFKDLEDLSPQRILEDLAKELDDEVEQTQDAAGIKKKPAPAKTTPKAGAKPTTTKSASATKSTTANKTPAKTPAKAPEAEKASVDTPEPETAETAAVQTETSQTEASQAGATVPDEAPVRKSDATAAATASAAAAAAVSKGVVKPEESGEATSVASGSDVSAGEAGVASDEASELGEGESASMEAATPEGVAVEQLAQTPVANDGAPSDVAEDEADSEPVADVSAVVEGESENSILPPELAVVDETEDQGRALATVQPQPEEFVLEDDVALEMSGIDETAAEPNSDAADAPSVISEEAFTSTEDGAPSSTVGGAIADETDGDGPAPVVRKTAGPAEPAPVSMNGKGVLPEDEG